MLESPAARPLARRLVAEGAEVRLSVARLADTNFVAAADRSSFAGTMAATSYARGYTKIVFNEAALRMSLDPRTAAGTLAHELLGHALETHEAERQGLSQAYGLFRENEMGATLLGWLVSAQLGRVPRFSDLERWLADPERQYEEDIYLGAGHALELSRAQMRDPVAAYVERLERIRRRRAFWEAERAGIGRQLAAIGRIAAASGRSAKDFDFVRARLESRFSVEIPRELALCDGGLKSVGEALRAVRGRRLRRKLISAADDPRMGRWEKQVQERAAALRKLVGPAPGPEPSPAPPEGQVSEAEFVEMLKADGARKAP
jgi:hypothetical protein